MTRSSRLLTFLSVLLAFSLFAAACGDDDSSSSDGSTDGAGAATATPAPTTATDGGSTDGDSTDGGAMTLPDDYDPEGVLHLPLDINGGTGIGIMDMTQVPVVGRIEHELVWGTLLRLTPDGKIVGDLAESWKIVDPQTISVTLREGLVFTDDSPLDAEALKYSWLRTKNAEVTTGIEAEWFLIDDVTTEGNLTATAHLSQPVAGAFLRLLRLAEGSPVSMVAAEAGVDLNKNTVGAGPYTLSEFVEGEKMVLVKNEKYWNADNILIPTIEFDQVTPDSLNNAVLDGVVDQALLGVAAINEVAGAKGWDIRTAPDSNVNLIGHICKNRPPFDNIDVRKAFNYGLDRDTINAIVYDGLAEPMWGFQGQGDFFNPELDGYYQFDLDKMKELLTNAGYSESNKLKVRIAYAGATTAGRAAEIAIQTWESSGMVEVENATITQTADFFPDAVVADMNFFELLRTGPNKVIRVLRSGIGNVCGWEDPVLNDLLDQLLAVDEYSAEGQALWKAISKEGIETAAHVFGLFGLRTVAENGDRIGSINSDDPTQWYKGDRFGTPVLDFNGLYIKK